MIRRLSIATFWSGIFTSPALLASGMTSGEMYFLTTVLAVFYGAPFAIGVGLIIYANKLKKQNKCSGDVMGFGILSLLVGCGLLGATLSTM